MGWNNEPIPWSEFERRLSARGASTPAAAEPQPEHSVPADPEEPPTEPTQPVVPYAELHAHSHFSFLDGASSPEQLIREATRLGLTGLALTDHDGFYGAASFADAAEAAARTTEATGLTPPLTVYGA